jgi:hypothetical protein
VRLGFFGSAHKDCTPAALPSIHVVEPPKLGLLLIRQATATTNRIRGCANLHVKVRVAIYRARLQASGSDHLIYEVINERGESKTYDVTIAIKPASQAPGIRPPVKLEKI